MTLQLAAGRLELRLAEEPLTSRGLRLQKLIAHGMSSLVYHCSNQRGEARAVRFTPLDIFLPTDEKHPELSEEDYLHLEYRHREGRAPYLQESRWASLASTMGFGVSVESISYVAGHIGWPGRPALGFTVVGMMVMDLYDGTLQKLKDRSVPDRQKILDLVQLMFSTGFAVDDIHELNIVFRRLPDGQLAWRFIDFERMCLISEFSAGAHKRKLSLEEYYLLLIGWTA